MLMQVGLALSFAINIVYTDTYTSTLLWSSYYRPSWSGSVTTTYTAGKYSIETLIHILDPSQLFHNYTQI